MLLFTLSTKIYSILNNIDSPYSISMDLWKSKYSDNFIGITVHLIDSNWEMKRFTYDLIPFSDNHTSDNIAQTVFEKLSSNLKEPPFAIITDNASNILKAARIMQSHYNK